MKQDCSQPGSNSPDDKNRGIRGRRGRRNGLCSCFRVFRVFRGFGCSLAAVWALLICCFVAASTRAAEPPARTWIPALLQDANAWPHSENDAHITVTARGLRVEVASGREFAIAAASQLALPKELGRIRISVAEVGGGAKWFVRLYGALRQPGDRRTRARV